jgi:hypothetical protein
MLALTSAAVVRPADDVIGGFAAFGGWCRTPHPGTVPTSTTAIA